MSTNHFTDDLKELYALADEVLTHTGLFLNRAADYASANGWGGHMTTEVVLPPSVCEQMGAQPQWPPMLPPWLVCVPRWAVEGGER